MMLQWAWSKTREIVADWWLLALLVLLIVTARVAITWGSSDGGFLAHLKNALFGADKETDKFWVDNIIQLIVFSGLTAKLVGIQAKDREARRRQPYLNWKWHVIVQRDGDGKIVDEEYSDIFWQDAQRYLESEFERWRAVKSIMTTRGTVHTPSIVDARDRKWLVDPMHALAREVGTRPDGSVEPPADWSDRTLVIDMGQMRKHFISPKPDTPPADADLAVVQNILL